MKPPLLCLQVQEGETVLTAANGRALRLVSVVNVLIANSQGQTLTEKQQVLPSGVIRERGKPLSEKLMPGEQWRDGVLRGIREELGGILPPEPKVSRMGWGRRPWFAVCFAALSAPLQCVLQLLQHKGAMGLVQQ